MRARCLIPVLVTLAVGTGRASAQSVEQQIRTEVDRYVQAINSGNPDSLAALYANQSSASSLGDGQINVGWRSIRDLLREVYQQVGTIRMTVDSLTVVSLGDRAALAFFRYRWVLGQVNPRSEAGAMTLVFLRAAQGWVVLHDHTSSLQAQTAPPAPGVPVTDSGPAGPTRPTTDCQVTRIIDGDTIECRRVGRVRLIGIDTPELGQQPFGALAATALAELLPLGSSAQLEGDVEPRDRYGRVLAYIWFNGAMVNWLMIRQGWAVLLTYPPNVQYVEWFTSAQRGAREEGRGLWTAGGFECTPVDRRRGRC